MRWLPTKVHGVLDYLVGLLFLVLPHLLGWTANAVALFTVLGAITIAYSLFTAYELGVLRVLPVELHLLLDGVLGIILLGIADLMFSQGRHFTSLVALFGLLELGTAAVTRHDVTVVPHSGDAYIIKDFQNELRLEAPDF